MVSWILDRVVHLHRQNRMTSSLSLLKNPSRTGIQSLAQETQIYLNAKGIIVEHLIQK